MRLRSLRDAIRLLLGLGLLAGLLPLPACQPMPAGTAWALADLRLLDPLDAPAPTAELLAAYTRDSSRQLDLRLDLLDIDPADGTLVRVTVWDEGAFRLAPLVVEIAPHGHTRTLPPEGAPAVRARVVRDFDLDTLTVSLNRHYLRGRVRMEVESSLDGQTADRLTPFDTQTAAPARRAAVVLAFRDSFPALTPAQALRRWDGAHTGPTGERHGLRHIVDSASRHRLPVFLLDLKTPSSLAALDYMGLTRRLRDLASAGLLVLPDAAWSEPADLALQTSLKAAAGFGLPASPFVFAAGGGRQAGYAAQFLPLSDPNHLSRAEGHLFIPLPQGELDEATANGPSLELRRRLIETALSADETDLLVLGGSLPASTWGDSDMAAPTFAWLAGHPWIQVLSAADLLTFPAIHLEQAPAASGPAENPWLEALRLAPDNALGAAAWQAYLTLSAPANDPALQSLRQVYLGQIGILLTAARWAEEPQALNDCTTDPDRDGQPECLLSDGSLLAVFETNGAVLSHLFLLQPDGPQQLIAPSSQFAVGLSDPSEWHPERGPAADPSILPGAFADTTATWQPYRPEILEDGIRFVSPAGDRTKTYRLIDAGLEVEYETALPVSTRIPLAVAAQEFFSQPVQYRAILEPASWTWGPGGGMQVEVHSQAVLTAQGFTASLPYLSLPEDPDLAYPPGHYLPFPLSEVRVSGEENFTVEVWTR